MICCKTMILKFCEWTKPYNFKIHVINNFVQDNVRCNYYLTAPVNFKQLKSKLVALLNSRVKKEKNKIK